MRSTRLTVLAALLYVVCLAPDVAQDRGLAVIAREAAGSPDFDVGKQYAVIIGIDKYQEWPGLHSAVSEAKAIKQVLSERYYIDDFFELYDQDASAANIRKLFLETLPARLGIHDSLLVFYAAPRRSWIPHISNAPSSSPLGRC